MFYPELGERNLAVLVSVHDVNHLLDLVAVQLTGQMLQHELDLVRVDTAVSVLAEHPDTLRLHLRTVHI